MKSISPGLELRRILTNAEGCTLTLINEYLNYAGITPFHPRFLIHWELSCYNIFNHLGYPGLSYNGIRWNPKLLLFTSLLYLLQFLSLYMAFGCFMAHSMTSLQENSLRLSHLSHLVSLMYTTRRNPYKYLMKKYVRSYAFWQPQGYIFMKSSATKNPILLGLDSQFLIYLCG